MEPIRIYILYCVFPLWIACGFLDYLCHRKSKIERNSGLHESIVHMIMFIEVGIPIFLGALFEINTLIIWLMFFVFVIHEITAVYDVWYASPRRTVSAWEQAIHNYLGLLPFMVGSVVVCLNVDQVFAGDFSLSFREVPIGWFSTLLAMSLILLAFPYSEELYRCYMYKGPKESKWMTMIEFRHPWDPNLTLNPYHEDKSDVD